MTLRVVKKFARYLRNTRAVSALEYALLLGLVATVIAAGIITLGPNITNVLTTIGTEVKEAQDAADD